MPGGKSLKERISDEAVESRPARSGLAGSNILTPRAPGK